MLLTTKAAEKVSVQVFFDSKPPYLLVDHSTAYPSMYND